MYLDIHSSARVPRGVDLLPPICVAEECQLEPGAIVGSHTALGKGCFVGEGALIEGSILCEGVHVEKGAIVRNSIVGPRAVICKDAIVSDFSVLGAGYVVDEGEILMNQKVWARQEGALVAGS